MQYVGKGGGHLKPLAFPNGSYHFKKNNKDLIVFVC